MSVLWSGSQSQVSSGRDGVQTRRTARACGVGDEAAGQQWGHFSSETPVGVSTGEARAPRLEWPRRRELPSTSPAQGGVGRRSHCVPEAALRTRGPRGLCAFRRRGRHVRPGTWRRGVCAATCARRLSHHAGRSLPGAGATRSVGGHRAVLAVATLRLAACVLTAAEREGPSVAPGRATSWPLRGGSSAQASPAQSGSQTQDPVVSSGLTRGRGQRGPAARGGVGWLREARGPSWVEKGLS